jgi:hypothetical protein
MEEEDRLTEGFAAQGPRALCSAAATVPGSNLDAEESLVGQQQWQAIHTRRAAGQSISAIARDLDLDRKTVRNCLQQQAWAPYRREVAAPTLLKRAPRVACRASATSALLGAHRAPGTARARLERQL